MNISVYKNGHSKRAYCDTLVSERKTVSNTDNTVGVMPQQKQRLHTINFCAAHTNTKQKTKTAKERKMKEKKKKSTHIIQNQQSEQIQIRQE